jgi:LemA protein
MGWTLAILAAALLAGAIFLYNRLIADRNLARQGYADIDVQLKRRADLVPQLVEAVKGYAGYEKALLTTVTELRANALAAPRALRWRSSWASGWARSSCCRRTIRS